MQTTANSTTGDASTADAHNSSDFAEDIASLFNRGLKNHKESRTFEVLRARAIARAESLRDEIDAFKESNRTYAGPEDPEKRKELIDTLAALYIDLRFTVGLGKLATLFMNGETTVTVAGGEGAASQADATANPHPVGEDLVVIVPPWVKELRRHLARVKDRQPLEFFARHVSVLRDTVKTDIEACREARLEAETEMNFARRDGIADRMEGHELLDDAMEGLEFVGVSMFRKMAAERSEGEMMELDA